jgi:hypothetical protein
MTSSSDNGGPTRHSGCRGWRILVAALVLTACSSGVSGVGRVELATDMNTALSRSITDRDLTLRVSQAEFQEDGDQLAWITQFDDPIETGSMSGASAEALLFEQPLTVFKDAVLAHEEDMRAADVDVFIIAFRDQQRTVFELPPELLWDFASGDLSWSTVVETMTITGL